MKRLSLIGGGIIAVLAIAIGVVPYLVPSEVYRSQIENQAEAALGRDVSLEGAARLSIFPRISARVEGVKIANPDGFSAPNMIEAGELRARVKFWPLLARRVEIAEISFVEANVSLERLPNGTANWEFGVETAEPSQPNNESSSGFDAGIDRARLVNSSLSFKDAIAGANYALMDLNARASMRALDQPLSFTGDGKLNGQSFDLTLNLDSVAAALAGGESVDADFALETDLGSISYSGEIIVDDIPTLIGSFEVSSEQVPSITSLIGVNAGIDLSALGTLSAKGNVSGKVDALKIDIERAAQDSDYFTASYAGLVDLGSSTPLDGRFSFKTGDAAQAADALALNLPLQLSPIGMVDMQGTVKGSFTSPQLKFDRLEQNSGLMTTDYSGVIILQADPTLDGDLNFSAKDAGRVLTLFGMDGGPADIIENVKFSGNLTGALSQLSLKEADLSHKGSLLDLSYKGDVALGSNGKITGPLSASSSDLRALLGALDVQLAEGETLKSFDIEGTLSGSPQVLTVEDLNLKIDDVAGTGTLGLNSSGSAPKVIADLNLPSLDLTPFLGEGSQDTPAREQTTGWSKAPLALDGLRAVDADIKLRSDLLIIGKIELEKSNVQASLAGGSLKADIAELNAFGGKWTGDLQLDARRDTPRLTIDMSGTNVAMQSILSTFANLQSVSGTGGMSFKATSTGNSLDALVRSLDGEIKTNLTDGAVKGFNLAQIVRSRETIISALTSGSLGFGLSPEAETDFTEFEGALTITNGVANIDLLRALNPAILLEGAGRIDLVNQSVDISFTPSVDTSGAGELSMLKLNGEPFALPFRIYGNWLSPNIAIDNAAISQQLRARATNQIGDRIANELGGDLGGILGDALGTPKQRQAPKNAKEEKEDPTAPQPSESDDETEPKSLEDAVEDAATDALKDIFTKGN